MYYSVQTCCMLKSKSEYMQIIIPKKAILDEMQVYITCVEDTIFIGKNLNAILCRCDICSVNVAR